MLYTIIITHADGTTTTIHTQAENTSMAHKKAVNGVTITDTNGNTRTIKSVDGDDVRIYATTQNENGNIITEGVQDGALTVCKRTTANMINREGGELQYRLYNEVRKPNTDDSDALDCISVAQLAILSAISDGKSIDEQYHRAYLELNKHLLLKYS